jgi:hypothetical protein
MSRSSIVSIVFQRGSRMASLGDLLPIGQLLVTEILLKDEVAQRNCAILGYFFLKRFHLNDQFQNMVCCRFIKG